MKKLVTTCVLLAAITTVTFAQSKTSTTSKTTTTTTRTTTGPTAEQIAERRAKMHQQQFSLTPDQYKGVYQAELDYAKQDQQVRASGQQPGPGQSAQMGMARDQKFKSVMSADQYSKYEATQHKTN